MKLLLESSKFYFLVTLIGLPVFGSAQEAILPTGGDAVGAGGSSSYSIGQVVYTTNVGAGATVSQGVQQPYEIFTVGVEEESVETGELSVYPNPTSDILTLKLEEFKVDELTYQLYDVSGKLLVKNTITTSETSISMEAYPPSIYLLKIIGTKELKTFKIIKN